MVTNSNGREVIMASNSKRGNFKCLKYWWYFNRLHLVPKVTPMPFTFGGIWHDGLEVAYTQGWDAGLRIIAEKIKEWINDSWDSGEDDKIAKVEDQCNTLTHMFDNHLDCFNADEKEWEVLGVEIPFRLGIRKHYRAKGMFPGWKIELLEPGQKANYDYEYYGVIDKVIKNRKSGHIWVGEYKTTKADPQQYEAKATLGFQKTGYAIAADLMVKKEGWGEKVTGVYFDITRKAYPKIPNTKKCKKCNTSAHIKKGGEAGKAFGNQINSVICDICNGSGEIGGKKCKKCNSPAHMRKGGELGFMLEKVQVLIHCEKCNGTGIEGVSSAECDTNLETYLKVFKIYPHLNKAEYAETIQMYAEMKDTYNHGFPLYVTMKKKLEFLVDLWEFFKNVRRFSKLGAREHFRARDWKCDSCTYSELCMEETQFLMNSMFDIVDPGPYPKEYLEHLVKKGICSAKGNLVGEATILGEDGKITSGNIVNLGQVFEQPMGEGDLF